MRLAMRIAFYGRPFYAHSRSVERVATEGAVARWYRLPTFESSFLFLRPTDSRLRTRPRRSPPTWQPTAASSSRARPTAAWCAASSCGAAACSGALAKSNMLQGFLWGRRSGAGPGGRHLKFRPRRRGDGAGALW